MSWVFFLSGCFVLGFIFAALAKLVALPLGLLGGIAFMSGVMLMCLKIMFDELKK